ncbi:MAG: molecular chaperone HtpG [bacterium]|nr:molecular chaperone HtpG [bacterium]
MTQKVESHAFQAEVQEVLSLVIHSLYKDRDIFLRELISNASDALDKLRFEALTKPEWLPEGEALGVALDANAETRTLTIADNGIGMDYGDLTENLGKVASSGTRKFLDALKEGGEGPELIGRFGVGFYSAFMVADQVTVETCKVGTDKGLRWQSDGKGEYTIEEVDGLSRGTMITLHLTESEEGQSDYTQEHILRGIVSRYSDFVEYPVQMEVERSEPKLDSDGKEIEGETEMVSSMETLNSMKPLWSRSKSDVTDEEYAEFYRHQAHDWSPPLETIHFNAEGALEFTALLFLPGQKPMNFGDGAAPKSKVSLYVRRVMVQKECEELLPVWLRFVQGVVETADLPLNVSRETLQSNRRVEQIQKSLVRKIMDTMGKMLEKEREKYMVFWKNFGWVIKEGLYYAPDKQESLAELCLFEGAGDYEYTTLAGYKSAMPEGQEAIYVLTGPDRATVEASAHLEGMRAKGWDVLFLTDPVDEWVLERLTEYDGTPIQRLDKGDLNLESEEEKKDLEEKQEAAGDLLKTMQESMSGSVSEVRFSSRLAESPAVLVEAEGGMSAHQVRMMRHAGQDVPDPLRILELNPDHPLVQGLQKLHAVDAGSPRVQEFSELLFDGAMMREGGVPKNPAQFQKLLTELMVASLKG